MTKYIVKRLLWMVPVIIGVSLLVFVLLDLSPGEPARMVLGDQATNEDVAEFNEKYGLDEPVLVQYGKYMWNVVTKGDFGESYVTGRSVTTESGYYGNSYHGGSFTGNACRTASRVDY